MGMVQKISRRKLVTVAVFSHREKVASIITVLDINI